MRQKYARLTIIVLFIVLAIEIGVSIKYFPQLESYKHQIQTDEELQILSTNKDDLSSYDHSESKYKGQLYRENSIITNLSKEGINQGKITIENMAVTPSIVQIDGDKKEIPGSGKITLEANNDTRIEILKGAVIIYNA